MVTLKPLAAAAFFLLGCFILGCATGISPQARSQVTYHGPFAALQSNPQGYLGQTVLLGGKILEVKATPDFSELAVLQMPLGDGDRPQEADQSQGRFLVRSDKFLDPAIYQKDLRVTVVGQVLGSEPRPIGELTYPYLVLKAKEIKIWQPGQRFPVIFGFGIGTWIH